MTGVHDVLYISDYPFLANSNHNVKDFLMLSSKKIKSRREMADLSQEQAGKVLGLTRPTYARRESLGKFTTAELQKLAMTFGCRINDLKDAPEPHELKARAERDAQIEAMRETITSLRSENETLREMIDMLKSQINRTGLCPILTTPKAQ